MKSFKIFTSFIYTTGKSSVLILPVSLYKKKTKTNNSKALSFYNDFYFSQTDQNIASKKENFLSESSKPILFFFMFYPPLPN